MFMEDFAPFMAGGKPPAPVYPVEIANSALIESAYTSTGAVATDCTIALGWKPTNATSAPLIAMDGHYRLTIQKQGATVRVWKQGVELASYTGSVGSTYAEFVQNVLAFYAGSYHGYYSRLVVVEQVLTYSDFWECSDFVTGLWVPKEVVVQEAQRGVLIPAATGSLDSSFTVRPDSAFDGTTVTEHGYSAVSKVNNSAGSHLYYMGKDYGAGNEKPIHSVTWFPSNNFGYVYGGSGTLTLTLKASNDGMNWDTLATATPDRTSTIATSLESSDKVTPYRYVRIDGAFTIISAGYLICTEMQIFETETYTYGPGGGLYDFGNAGDLGADVSGGGNHWTIAGTQTGNTPTQNGCTWNPLHPGSSLSGGNLTKTTSRSVSTFRMEAGKWAWKIPTVAVGGTLGLMNVDGSFPASNYYLSMVAGSSYEFFYDADASTFSYKVDGGALMQVGTGITASAVVIYCDANCTAQFIGFTPSEEGFKALCSANLPNPTVMKSAKAAQVITRVGMPFMKLVTAGSSVSANGDTATINASGIYRRARTSAPLKRDAANGKKYYWEVLLGSGCGNYVGAGCTFSGSNLNSGAMEGDFASYVNYSGHMYNGSGYVAAVASRYTADGDTLMLAYDETTGNLWWGKNGTWYAYDGSGSTTTIAGTPTWGGISSDLYPDVEFGYYTSAGASVTFKTKAVDFTYSVPDGFEPLGNHPNSECKILTPDMEGGPDFIAVKNRESADHWRVFDALRGDNKRVYFNLASGQDTSGDLLQFTAGDQYSVGSSSATNFAGLGFLDLCLKAGIDQGFEIVTYTGDGVGGRTVSHNLGKTPTFMIVKCISNAFVWCVYHTALGAAKYLRLNTTDAAITSSLIWNDTEPTSTNFSVGTDLATNGNGEDYVAYLFADSDIFKAFSYTGNASTDGPFVNLGGRILSIPFARNTAGRSAFWVCHDTVREPTNPVEKVLFPDASDIETTVPTSYAINVTSQGFKVISTDTPENGSGDLHVGLAILESTAKYSNTF